MKLKFDPDVENLFAEIVKCKVKDPDDDTKDRPRVLVTEFHKNLKLQKEQGLIKGPDHARKCRQVSFFFDVVEEVKKVKTTRPAYCYETFTEVAYTLTIGTAIDDFSYVSIGLKKGILFLSKFEIEMLIRHNINRVSNHGVH